MSSSFTFIPRSVAKEATRKSIKNSTPSKATSHVPQRSGPGQSTAHQTLPFSGTQTEKDAKRREDELLVLIEAALSDYSCWCNPELQREMKSGQDGCE